MTTSVHNLHFMVFHWIYYIRIVLIVLKLHLIFVQFFMTRVGLRTSEVLTVLVVSKIDIVCLYIYILIANCDFIIHVVHGCVKSFVHETCSHPASPLSIEFFEISLHFDSALVEFDFECGADKVGHAYACHHLSIAFPPFVVADYWVYYLVLEQANFVEVVDIVRSVLVSSHNYFFYQLIVFALLNVTVSYFVVVNFV